MADPHEIKQMIRCFREAYRDCPDDKRAERDCKAWELIKKIVDSERK